MAAATPATMAAATAAAGPERQRARGADAATRRGGGWGGFNGESGAASQGGSLDGRRRRQPPWPAPAMDGGGGCGSRSRLDPSSASAGGASMGAARWLRCRRPSQLRGRVVRLPMKIAPASAMADDGGVSDVVSLSRHRHCSPRHPSWTAPGETLDLGLPDRTMTTLSGSFSLLGASFWSSCWLGRARRFGVLRHLTRQQRRVLAARRSGVSALDV